MRKQKYTKTFLQNLTFTEEAANRTLSNILRQLASLGEHAVDIFEGLENESESLQKRSENLNKRIVSVEETLKVIINGIKDSS